MIGDIQIHGPIPGFNKSWSLAYHKDAVMYPLCYFRKPSYVPQKTFDRLLDGICLSIDQGTVDAIKRALQENSDERRG
jgi:hypothetical protein